MLVIIYLPVVENSNIQFQIIAGISVTNILTFI